MRSLRGGTSIWRGAPARCVRPDARGQPPSPTTGVPMTLLAPGPTTPVAPASLDLERLGPGFGAQVHDVDLSRATDEQVLAVRGALAEHKVLFFSGQHDLDPDSQVALGRRLGRETESHPIVPGVDDRHPEIYALDSAEGGFADVWHTDVTFVRRPPLGSV